jgi:cell division control protein CDC15
MINIEKDSGGHITTSCDIWSLGCTIIELLTGNPPYHDGNRFYALSRMVSEPHPPLPKDISPECEDFLMQCFKKEPELRADAKRNFKYLNESL